MVPPRVKSHHASRVEADLLLGLERAKGAWLDPPPKIFEVYPGDQVSEEVRSTSFVCDVLLVSRADKRSPVTVHGIEIRADESAARIKDRTLRWLEQTVDHAWIAFPSGVEVTSPAAIPTQLGIIAVDVTGTIRVVRPAPLLKRDKAPGELLARDLLARSLRWWK